MKTRKLRLSHRQFLILIAVLSSLVLMTVGCGKQEFVANPSTTLEKAPGSFSIPPKIDLLLVEDDTGSMGEIFSDIKQQMPLFLKDLDREGWDYHFGMTPITSVFDINNPHVDLNRTLLQVAASFYDPSWFSLGLWTPPFPGALPPQNGLIPTGVLRSASNYNYFITSPSNASGGFENGLESTLKTLTEKAPQVGFLRSDAMLVVLVVGNGEDTSRVTFCNRSTQRPPLSQQEANTAEYVNVCEWVGGLPQYYTYQSSLNHYQTSLSALKNSPALIRFYAAVSLSESTVCRGKAAHTYRGTRYLALEQFFNSGNSNVDICKVPISNELSQISSQLSSTKGNFRQHYIPLPYELEESTIQVTKYTHGDVNQSHSLAHDSANGWTYVILTETDNAFVIDDPVRMNHITGPALELHGDARLTGDDTLKWTGTRKGLRNSAP